MRARQRKAECLRLRPVKTRIIACRVFHGLAGIGIVAVEKQSFDPGAGKRFIPSLVRGDFEQGKGISHIAHRQQPVDTQGDKTCVERLAHRHAGLGYEQAPGDIPQRGRTQSCRHPRHQSADDGPRRALPEGRREAAPVLADQPDGVGVHGFQPVDGDPGPVERARRNGNPGRRLNGGGRLSAGRSIRRSLGGLFGRIRRRRRLDHRCRPPQLKLGRRDRRQRHRERAQRCDRRTGRDVQGATAQGARDAAARRIPSAGNGHSEWFFRFPSPEPEFPMSRETVRRRQEESERQ